MVSRTPLKSRGKPTSTNHWLLVVSVTGPPVFLCVGIQASLDSHGGRTNYQFGASTYEKRRVFRDFLNETVMAHRVKEGRSATSADAFVSWHSLLNSRSVQGNKGFCAFE